MSGLHPSALLDAAATLVREVLRLEQPADAAVSQHFKSQRQLGARERHTLAETAYAVLRLRLWAEHLADFGGAVAPKTRHRRMAAAVWQGDPSVLQAALTEPEQHWWQQIHTLQRRDAAAELQHNLPDWLANPLRDQLGSGFAPLGEALLNPAPLDLRANALKLDRERLQARLAEEGITSRPTPYSPLGLRVEGRPALQRTQAFQDGLMEVQDEGSQLLALVLGARRGEMVVDFCAGAGGKTLALGAAMRNTGRLYALDTSGHRLAALTPRLARSGLSNVYPIQIAHERDERIQRLAGKIDRVLVDAPCSGLGTLRRNPDLKWRHSPKEVQALAARQCDILAAAARLLKPGGRLVYATCSLLVAENEAVATEFDTRLVAGAGQRFEPLHAATALEAAAVGQAADLVDGRWLRLWPHRHGCDGFFAAAWQRV